MAAASLGWAAFYRGEYALATQVLEERLGLCEKLGDCFILGIALANLAEALYAQGDHGRALSRFAESLRLYRVIGDGNIAAVCLEGVARVLRARGQVGGRRCKEVHHPAGATRARTGGTHGAHFFAAAASLRETLDAPFRPAEKVDYDPDMAAVRAALRAALGPQAFAAAWACGHALTPEQAVVEALEAAGDQRTGE